MTPFTVEDEIKFWGRQMSEHMLFIHLDVHDETLKREAWSHKEAWTRLSSCPSNCSVTDEIILELDSTLEFQRRLLSMGDRSLYPSFLKHIISESLYFLNKLLGNGYSMQEEVAFWTSHHLGELSVQEKLLDPEEIQLSAIIRKFTDEIASLGEDRARMTMNISTIIDNYNTLEFKLGTDDIKSIISTTMLDHTIREGERALKIMQWFSSYENSITNLR